ncbi:MAG: EAL domain-containing protein [Terracidiphilus sp.]|jgi:sensor c-di-GMP phosphodiesterase-like protein
MKRSIKQRALITAAATLVAAAFGLLAGYWIGREIALRLTASKLSREAALAISETETYSHDDHAVLDAMNASSYPYCSVEDIEFLRHLLSHSIFLKEIGRIRDNRIACSTTLGREHPSSTELPKPDTIGPDGVKVYRNPLFFGLPNVTALQYGDSYVLLYPYFDILRQRSSVHFLTTTVGPEPDQPSSLAGGAALPSWPQRSMDSDFRIGEFLYSTRCSPLSIDHICMTAYFSVSEALLTNRGARKAMLALGGPAGGFFGFIVALLYRRNRSMSQQLRRAVRKDKLRFVYQPIVALESGEIIGAEALARWNDEDGVAVGPDQFIKIAEAGGFVGQITQLAVRHSAHDFADEFRTHPDFHVSVNVAAADLADPRFLPMLDEEMLRAGVKPESLSIEITESSTARHEVAIATILRLRERGHQVHIDDFGTGYSSLSYLNDLSVGAIKIDRSFTRAIGTGSVTLSILPQILAMAEALKLQVIVEGIETSLQASYFSALTQPILGQGWLFGRPVPAEEFHRLLAGSETIAPLLASAALENPFPCSLARESPRFS